MEGNDDLHHTNRLRQGAEEIVVRETVLLQEIFSNNLGDLEGALLILGQRIFTNQLHDFLQIIFLLKDFFHLLLQHAVLWIELLEERLKDSDVLRKRDVPIDRREVLSLGQLLVQAPEDLHNAESGRCYWVCEISSWRRYCTDNCNRALSSWISQA